MEMTSKPIGEHFAIFDALELAPVVACETTPQGWRGLTADGEVLDVRGRGRPDGRLCVNRNGRPVGYHAIPQEMSRDGMIDDYLSHFNRALALYRANEPARALREIDNAIGIAPTTYAKRNRAQILLSLGQWVEGFEQYAEGERSPIFMRKNYRAALELGMQPWQGEDLRGKRLLLIHDHGFGDSIMALRYVAQLKAMGADVILKMPLELAQLGMQCGLVVSDFVDADYFCPLILLLHFFCQSPDKIPLAPYLEVETGLRSQWRDRVDAGQKTIGIAWSVGVQADGDYPRAAPLAMFVEQLADRGQLYSVQQQGVDAALAAGVAACEFQDFADCAALMSVLDEIVAVDTAALHLAGAIGHPRIHALLSYWHSWRWQSPLYQNIHFCRQQTAGDWTSAFAQIARPN
jgi:hypothetical protein